MRAAEPLLLGAALLEAPKSPPLLTFHTETLGHATVFCTTVSQEQVLCRVFCFGVQHCFILAGLGGWEQRIHTDRWLCVMSSGVCLDGLSNQSARSFLRPLVAPS